MCATQRAMEPSPMYQRIGKQKNWNSLPAGIELGVSFFAEEFFVFFRDRPACRAEKVHAGHSVVPHSGMQRMIEGLAVHGDALQAVADKPFSCVYAGACRIMIVCF